MNYWETQKCTCKIEIFKSEIVNINKALEEPWWHVAVDMRSLAHVHPTSINGFWDVTLTSEANFYVNTPLTGLTGQWLWYLDAESSYGVTETEKRNLISLLTSSVFCLSWEETNLEWGLILVLSIGGAKLHYWTLVSRQIKLRGLIRIGLLGRWSPIE